MAAIKLDNMVDNWTINVFDDGMLDIEEGVKTANKAINEFLIRQVNHTTIYTT